MIIRNHATNQLEKGLVQETIILTNNPFLTSWLYE